MSTQDHYLLLKKVKNIENDTMVDLKQMLSAKIQEIDLLVQTKASEAELQVIRNNKIGQEEMQYIEEELKGVKALIHSLEGDDDNDEEVESESATPMVRKEAIKPQGPVILYGNENSRLKQLFQDFITKLKQDQGDGKSMGFKKHLKYHQQLIIEIVNKLLYDDDRFENMRKEILNQRDQMELYRKEGQSLSNKVDNSMKTIDTVNNVLEEMTEFKQKISLDNEKAQESVK